MPINQASEVNRLWWVRAQSWAEGAGQTPYDQRDRTQEIVDASEAKYRQSLSGDDVLPDPHNFHSNPGYMGTTTAGSLTMSQPGSIYRQTGGGEGHRPMAVGGPARQSVPGRSVGLRRGRTVPPAGPAREPTGEGAPLVVSTGGMNQ